MSETPTGGYPGGRRRIDRVLAEHFTAGLADLDIDEVRAKRRDAEQEEADLSYVRRMLQGRMDILRAELARRSGGGERIVDALSTVLAETGRTDHGMGRFIRVTPSRVDEHRRLVEQLIADVGISDVVKQSDEELGASLRRLEEYERSVSEDRRRVQGVMDRLTAEIAARYKSGAASVDDLLADR